MKAIMNTPKSKFHAISKATVGIALLVLLSSCGKKVSEDWAAYQVAQDEVKQLMTAKMMALGPKASKRDATAAEFEALNKELDAAQKEITDKVNTIKPETKVVQDYHATFTVFVSGALGPIKQTAQYFQDKNQKKKKKALEERVEIQEKLKLAEKAVMNELEKAK